MLELNRIYNVDCLDGLELIDDNSVDCIITSPPYFNAREYAQWQTYDSYLAFIGLVMIQCARVLRTGGFICWNVSPRIVVDGKKYSIGFDTQALLEYIPDHYHEPVLTYYDNLIWEKPKGGYRLSYAETKWQKMCKDGDRPVRLMPRYENIFIYSKGDPFTLRAKMAPQNQDFWYFGNVIGLGVDHLVGHHGVFPLDLPLRMIDWFCMGDLVLDPFMGRGTTAKAAKLLGKNYIGFEIHQEYIDIGKKYLEE